MTTPHPADPAMTDEEIERLAYSMANAKLGEGPAARCEGPTGYEIAQARFWAHRARHYFDTHLAAEIAARKEAEEREAYWQGVAERALAKQHDMQREIDAAREDARIRLAQRPFDEAYARIEPIVALYLRTAGTDSECLTETACNRILEAAFRHTFDADWLALEARAVAAEARIAELDDLLAESNVTLGHAFNRIHCLPRTTDTELAGRIGNIRARITRARTALGGSNDR